MPNLPAKLAMIESGVPPAERWREKSPGQLAGPQRGGADGPFPTRSLAKFHAPEIVFGPCPPPRAQAPMSQFAVVTDTAARIKITIISRTLVPEISVIDPRLLTTMPDWLNAATGLDAPKRLAQLGVSEDVLPHLARTTLQDACLATNPRKASAGDIEALFRAAL